jgi:ubiquinone/menaquinone biosynthesis C-methylase UbiE
MNESAPHIRKNRDYWDKASADYQEQHGAVLFEQALAWGVWRIPEAEVKALGDLEGRAVLEFGCGGAQWSVALALRGIQIIGMDLSAEQLTHARRLAARADAPLPLVQASAENTPFADASFDIVFCDHGAMTFADPYRTVPEAARLLRPGGRLVFCMSTPFLDICYDPIADAVTPRMVLPYFGLSRMEDALQTTFQLPYGEWIRLFRRHGLTVENLIELQAGPNAVTTYTWYAPLQWARRWPAEHIWQLQKQ